MPLLLLECPKFILHAWVPWLGVTKQSNLQQHRRLLEARLTLRPSTVNRRANMDNTASQRVSTHSTANHKASMGNTTNHRASTDSMANHKANMGNTANPRDSMASHKVPMGLPRANMIL